MTAFEIARLLRVLDGVQCTTCGYRGPDSGHSCPLSLATGNPPCVAARLQLELEQIDSTFTA